MQGFLDGDLTSAECDYVERARAFGRDVLAGKGQALEAGESVVETMKAAAAHDLLRMETPTSHGGLGHRFLVKLAVLEALSRVDMAFAFAMTNTQNVAARLTPGRHDKHVEFIIQGEVFAASALSEPGAAGGIADRHARRCGDGGGKDRGLYGRLNRNHAGPHRGRHGEDLRVTDVRQARRASSASISRRTTSGNSIGRKWLACPRRSKVACGSRSPKICGAGARQVEPCPA